MPAVLYDLDAPVTDGHRRSRTVIHGHRRSPTVTDDADDAEDQLAALMRVLLMQMMPSVCAATSPPRLLAPRVGVRRSVAVTMLMMLGTGRL